MPINFVTGLPRQGKTLFTFIQIQERAKKENRPVFYCNIPEVTLEGWTQIDHPDKWMECPNDSIIVVDELQDFWGAASSGARVPEPILELSKHGKRGIDFYFITQDPTLVHNTPRKLTETHWYVVRAFGTENALAYKFKGMQTDPGKVVQKAEKYPWRYPKEAFGKKDKAGNWITKPWYKSADVHNIKRQIPLKLVAIPFILLLGIAAVWFAVSSVLSFGDRMKATAGAAAPGAASISVARAPGLPSVSAPGQAGPAVMTTQQYAEARSPRIPGFPNTAPVYDQVTQPTEAPYPAACVQMGKRCECYTQQATLLRISHDLCMEIVKRGYFMDWKRPEAAPQPAPRREEPMRAAAPAQPPVVINMPAQAPPAQPQNGYLESLALRNSQVRTSMQQ